MTTMMVERRTSDAVNLVASDMIHDQDLMKRVAAPSRGIRCGLEVSLEAMELS
jgi:hypothetical protein